MKPDKAQDLHAGKMDGYPVQAQALQLHRPLSLRSHRFWELICCSNSCGAECLLGSVRYSLQRGDVLVIPPGISHALFLQPEQEAFSCYSLWIQGELVHKLQERFPYLSVLAQNSGTRLRTAGTVWEYMTEAFRSAALDAQLQAHGWDCAVVGLAINLLGNLSRALEEQTPRSTGEKIELLDQILTYLEGVLFDRITLADVAGKFWVSQSTVSHLFTREMGISFYQYILKRRLTEAKNLILEQMPIEKVSDKVGFGDYSTFYRAFKQEFGMSPKAFRQQNCGE